MTNPPMMKCGHAANAKIHDTGEPVCVICYGITPGADQIVPGPDLTGRTARCTYPPLGHKDVPSDMNLAFFSHRPTKPHDEYYCGCYGWD